MYEWWKDKLKYLLESEISERISGFYVFFICNVTVRGRGLAVVRVGLRHQSVCLALQLWRDADSSQANMNTAHTNRNLGDSVFRIIAQKFVRPFWNTFTGVLIYMIRGTI